MGTLDNWDPVIVNSLAREREVITIDNRGIGFSGGETPDNVQDMSIDALSIHALGITSCDLLGLSLGWLYCSDAGRCRGRIYFAKSSSWYSPPGCKGFKSISPAGEKARRWIR
jgi:pimeloyl-ACP methyl ester carboxylesterase